jgi:hypothetical protein
MVRDASLRDAPHHEVSETRACARSLDTNNPSGRPEIGAQFQLWIFSYTILAGSSKKYVSRVMIDFANDFALLI